MPVRPTRARLFQMAFRQRCWCRHWGSSRYFLTSSSMIHGQRKKVSTNGHECARIREKHRELLFPFVFICVQSWTNSFSFDHRKRPFEFTSRMGVSGFLGGKDAVFVRLFLHWAGRPATRKFGPAEKMHSRGRDQSGSPCRDIPLRQYCCPPFYAPSPSHKAGTHRWALSQASSEVVRGDSTFRVLRVLVPASWQPRR